MTSFPTDGLKGRFIFNNKQCATTLYLPPKDQLTAGRPRATLMMVHGWGGTQKVLINHFIEHFLAEGLAIFTFDYANWGDSEGLPRNTINPWQRVRNAEAALAYLKSLSEVDADKIFLWGSSFGGGHVVDLAVAHPELLGAIAQVPMLDGLAAVTQVPLPRLMRFAGDITLDILNPFTTRYLPIVSDEGQYSSMDRDGASRTMDWVKTHLNEKYDNRVSAKSMMTMGFYQPYRRLPHVQLPLLIVGASHDTVAPFNAKKVYKYKSASTEVAVIDANHFDPYLKPWFDENIKIQSRFIEQLLQQ